MTEALRGDPCGSGSRLIRVNLMVSSQDSNWLDEFAHGVRRVTGGRVSRSQIVRAALAGLRELDRIAASGGALPLKEARNGAELVALTILTIRKLGGR